MILFLPLAIKLFVQVYLYFIIFLEIVPNPLDSPSQFTYNNAILFFRR